MSDKYNGIEYPDDPPMFPGDEDDDVEFSRSPWECMVCGKGFESPELNDKGPCCPYCDSTDIDERDIETAEERSARYAAADADRERPEVRARMAYLARLAYPLGVTGEHPVAETKVTESSLPIPNLRRRQAS